ncbi:hypothetical protein O6H91_12G027300 [Diphasiastrum complanatum]|uniref:Uncharacterized protein n=1 Tax=Diphasiastrum complanatum TaxID=34168 RepID=A0ACC2C026_DIPCM|nr:hypothetical protein O6H91_12G027300 [Diphasiastrum complanatum]
MELTGPYIMHVQEHIFNMVGKPITDACLQGYHCCLIAYGQTGAGKTFTMEGPTAESEASVALMPEFQQKKGLIPRILDYIFQRMAAEKSKDMEFGVKCSYLQIYNEQVADLLDPESTNLTIHEDLKAGMYVEGLQEILVSTPEVTYGVFRKGSENRHVGMTAMNQESSRSHGVFTLVVESKHNVGGVMNRRISRFYLVDLAGSERQKHSETVGIRLKEAGSINKSLSALGNVIKALVDISEGKERHVPYRDSKLTFLLKDALGGNSKCTLIANVSPADKNSEETLSTLKFAQRAKLMRNLAVVNEDMFGNPAVMGEEIKKLKLEIAALRALTANAGSTILDYPILSAIQDDAGMPSDGSRVNRLVHIMAESRKQAVTAEQKAAAEKHELELKLETAQALSERLETCLQSQKMIIRLRENTIKRLEGSRPALDSGFEEMKEEIELLRKQIEHHPDAIKFKTELDLCKERLQEYEQKINDDDLQQQVFRLESLNQSLKNELHSVIEEKESLYGEISEIAKERNLLKAQLSTVEEQFAKLQEVAESFRQESKEAIQRRERTEGKLIEAIREQDEVWRKCNLAEAQATEIALDLAKQKTEAIKVSSALQEQKKMQEEMLLELQKANKQCDEAKSTTRELSTRLDEALNKNSKLQDRITELEAETQK